MTLDELKTEFAGGTASTATLSVLEKDPKIKRGEIYFIKSTYQEEGSEQYGDRPAVIVSNDLNNLHSQTVEIVYMTTKPKKDLPTHVLTRSAQYPSTILCEQIYSVGKQRMGNLIGTLTSNELQNVDRALAISLGIDFDCIKITKEPDEKEIKALLQENAGNMQLMPMPDDSRIVKLETERNVYKQLYNELLEKITQKEVFQNG